MRSPIGIALAIAALAFLALPDQGGSAREGKDPHKGWVDYENLNQVERLKERPGNYQALAAAAQFFEDIHAVRPDYSRCAYPLQLDALAYAKFEDLQKELDEQARGDRRPTNHLRQYNVQIHAVTVHSAGSFAESAEFKRLHEFEQKRFAEVRKRHPGRAVVLLVKADLESLKSEKVEDGVLILYLILSEGRWRVAWFDK